jgi:glucokinase
VAELVNGRGEITSGLTIHWQGLDVQDRLSALAPATVEADVRAAALGEALYGAGRGCRNVVYVSVGTGISYSLVQDGRPYAGARGNALILASSPMTHSCSHCGRRSAQVLEDFASGRAIGLRYSARVGGGSHRGEDVMRLADQGDLVAIEIVETAGEALGVAVGFLVNILDPAIVVIGGGLGLCGGRYWKCFVESAREHIWAKDSRKVPIVTAALGRDAGVMGAAAAFLESGKMRRAHNGQDADK